MSLKSLLQRLAGIPAREVPAVDVTRLPDPLARLRGRSDWHDGLSAHKQIMPGDAIEPVETDGGGADMVAPWDRPGARYMSPMTRDPWSGELPAGPDKWPATDDPYASPEPCTIVPDPALAAINDPRAHALTRPMDSVKSVTDLIDLIQRQEAAENILTERFGWYWDREEKIWTDPN